MKEHEIKWYEAEDGHIFQDEDECAEHEMNYFKQLLGIQLFDKDKKEIEKINFKDDETYNNTEYIKINKEKQKEYSKEYEQFIEYMRWYYGYCVWEELFQYAKHNSGNLYKIRTVDFHDIVEPIDEL